MSAVNDAEKARSLLVQGWSAAEQGDMDLANRSNQRAQVYATLALAEAIRALAEKATEADR